MAFARFFARSAQGHPLIDQTIFADDSSFSYHYTHTVVYECPSTDRCPWMNFNACKQPGNLGNETGDDRQAQTMEPMSQAVKPNSMQTGVTEQDFQPVTGGWVTIENYLKIREQ